jgi:hypothetical protein
MRRPQLVLSSDRSMAGIPRELGVHHTTLGNWVSDERRRLARAADPPAVNINHHSVHDRRATPECASGTGPGALSP